MREAKLPIKNNIMVLLSFIISTLLVGCNVSNTLEKDKSNVSENTQVYNDCLFYINTKSTTEPYLDRTKWIYYDNIFKLDLKTGEKSQVFAASNVNLDSADYEHPSGATTENVQSISPFYFLNGKLFCLYVTGYDEEYYFYIVVIDLNDGSYELIELSDIQINNGTEYIKDLDIGELKLAGVVGSKLVLSVNYDSVYEDSCDVVFFYNLEKNEAEFFAKELTDENENYSLYVECISKEGMIIETSDGSENKYIYYDFDSGEFINPVSVNLGSVFYESSGNIYYLSYNDDSENPKTYINRSTLDGKNQEVIETIDSYLFIYDTSEFLCKKNILFSQESVDGDENCVFYLFNADDVIKRFTIPYEKLDNDGYSLLKVYVAEDSLICRLDSRHGYDDYGESHQGDFYQYYTYAENYYFYKDNNLEPILSNEYTIEYNYYTNLIGYF